MRKKVVLSEVVESALYPVAVLGDLHIGIKDFDDNFFVYQNLFFDEIFLPEIKNRGIKNLVVLGDIFHNRKMVNIKFINNVKQLFRKFSEAFENIYITLGNHDFYYKNSYDISLADILLAECPNLRSLGDEFIKIDGQIQRDSLLVKYKINRQEYLDLFETIPEEDRKDVRYMYGHFDFVNFFYNSTTKNLDQTALNVRDVKNYFPNIVKVISGHYHTPQENDIIKYVGVPYQLSWSELGALLGFNIVTPDKIEFIKNPYDMFTKISLPEHKDIDTDIYCDTRYKQIFKVIYKENGYYLMADAFNRKLSEAGHDCITICLDNFNTQIQQEGNNEEICIEDLIKDYIMNCNQIVNDEKEDFYKLFIGLYEQSKNDISTIEI